MAYSVGVFWGISHSTTFYLVLFYFQSFVISFARLSSMFAAARFFDIFFFASEPDDVTVRKHDLYSMQQTYSPF